MKKSETTKIVAKLMTVYPSFKFGVNVLTGEDSTLLEIVNIWHEMIGDMEYGKAETAVNACINKCKFVPSIADIREEYDELISAEKKEQGAIKTNYDYARGSYPQSIEAGYAWEEWKTRATDGTTAELFKKVIDQYVRECDKKNEDVMDFKKCVETICRDKDGKIFFKEDKK